jgi:hypothetical protein
MTRDVHLHRLCRVSGESAFNHDFVALLCDKNVWSWIFPQELVFLLHGDVFRDPDATFVGPFCMSDIATTI